MSRDTFGLEKKATPEMLARIMYNPAFDEYVVGTLGNWRIYLCADQRYLGRSYAWWLGKSHVDLMDPSNLPPHELHDLFYNVGRRFKTAVQELWGATHINYAWLGNETPIHRGHGHLHLIPRYFGETPKYLGSDFADPNVGKNYKPSDPRKLSEDVLFQMRDTLRKVMRFA